MASTASQVRCSLSQCKPQPGLAVHKAAFASLDLHNAACTDFCTANSSCAKTFAEPPLWHFPECSS